MKKKTIIIIAVIVLLAIVTGFLVYKAVGNKAAAPIVEQQNLDGPTPIPADPNLVVIATWSRSADNTVIISVKAMASKYQSVGYELTYDSQGLIKGVNSGSKPIDVTGKDSFSREIYLGTCSRNVCKPDLGVKTVSVALEFIDTVGIKSQFSKDFTL